jgi:hypothetical protein
MSYNPPDLSDESDEEEEEEEDEVGQVYSKMSVPPSPAQDAGTDMATPWPVKLYGPKPLWAGPPGYKTNQEIIVKGAEMRQNARQKAEETTLAHILEKMKDPYPFDDFFGWSQNGLFEQFGDDKLRKDAFVTLLTKIKDELLYEYLAQFHEEMLTTAVSQNPNWEIVGGEWQKLRPRERSPYWAPEQQ